MSQKEITLIAENKTAEEKNNPLRSSGYIPAIVYGADESSQMLKIKRIAFEKAFEAAGEASLIDLKIGDQEKKVIIKDYQKDPVKNIFIHVDFFEVNMKKEITTEIPLNFIGEAKAIKELGGILIKEFDALEVKCLPGDLVNHIDVDISSLKNLHDAIHASDLKIPQGLELTIEADEVVASVIEPRVEKEETPAEEGAEAEKKEETPAEEGAEAEKKE